MEPLHGAYNGPGRFLLAGSNSPEGVAAWSRVLLAQSGKAVERTGPKQPMIPEGFVVREGGGCTA